MRPRVRSFVVAFDRFREFRFENRIGALIIGAKNHKIVSHICEKTRGPFNLLCVRRS